VGPLRPRNLLTLTVRSLLEAGPEVTKPAALNADGASDPAFDRSRQDLRDARDRFLIRLGGEIVVGEAVVVEGDGGGHDALAVAGDSVATSAWDLGDEAVAAEFDDEP
jgi:hypothetical protein